MHRLGVLLASPHATVVILSRPGCDQQSGFGQRLQSGADKTWHVQLYGYMHDAGLVPALRALKKLPASFRLMGDEK